MKENQNQKPFQLPESILSQLNEFSNGGFLLVRMGEGQNPPEIYFQADNPITSIGMINFINIWTESMLQMNKDIMMDNMLDSEDDDNEEE